MAKSGRKSLIDREMEYAEPFGAVISAEINRVLKDVPKKDRDIAFVAMMRVLMHIWATMMRQAGHDRTVGVFMLLETWGHIIEMDEEEKEAMGGLH